MKLSNSVIGAQNILYFGVFQILIFRVGMLNLYFYSSTLNPNTRLKREQETCPGSEPVPFDAKQARLCPLH